MWQQNKPMNRNRILNTLVGIFLIVALIGFADAAYLTAKHFAGEIPPCSLTYGCEYVLTSAYATIGNIPISLIGAAYYLFLFCAAVFYVDTKNARVLRVTAYATMIGLVTSAILIAIQIFILRSFCLYCLISAGTSTTLFLLGVVILKKLGPHSIVDTNKTQ